MKELFSLVFVGSNMTEQESNELMEKTSANFFEGLSNIGNQK